MKLMILFSLCMINNHSYPIIFLIKFNISDFDIDRNPDENKSINWSHTQREQQQQQQQHHSRNNRRNAKARRLHHPHPHPHHHHKYEWIIYNNIIMWRDKQISGDSAASTIF